MPEIADILAAFGYIDELVGKHSDNPEIVATVERLLPGTTGYNQGWYRQVTRLFEEIAVTNSTPPIGEVPTLPSFGDALENLSADTVPSGNPWPLAQQARARYASTVLTELESVQPGIVGNANTVARVTKVLGHTGFGIDQERADKLQTLIQKERPSQADWHQFMVKAQTLGLVDDDEVDFTPPTRGKVRVVGDQICAELDAPYKSMKVSLDQVEEILAPVNWTSCGPKYWTSVVRVESPANEANWTRIYEVVRPDPNIAEIKLTTALMYRIDRVRDGVVVNYDLDVDTTNSKHDGFVLVDQGYIWARKLTPNQADSDKGVKIFTRKVAHVQGLGAAALAMYAYAVGWYRAGEELLVNCAENASGHKNPKPSQPALNPTPRPEKKTPGIPQIDPQDRENLIDKVVETATKAVNSRAKRSADLIQRWLDGKLGPADIQQFAADAGVDLATAQKDLHDSVTKLVSFDGVQKTGE